MGKLKRFGVSLDEKLLESFDRLIRKEKYNNRSEALRDLIRKELVNREWELGKEVVGVITIVYDHHIRELVDKIIGIQHQFPGMVKASQHIHLDHHNCLEVIIAEGEPERIKSLAFQLKALRGVKHCVFTPTTTGRKIK